MDIWDEDVGRSHVSALHGKTLVSIKGLFDGGDEVTFVDSDGGVYRMFHSQDCCESVIINDVEGDVTDLIWEPIVIAEESTSSDSPPDGEYVYESFTWTFYRLATAKGYVVIRWLGESNGYYSESVDFYKV